MGISVGPARLSAKASPVEVTLAVTDSAADLPGEIFTHHSRLPETRNAGSGGMRVKIMKCRFCQNGIIKFSAQRYQANISGWQSLSVSAG